MLSNNEIEMELTRRYANDFELYCCECLKVEAFGTRRLVPLILNPSQKIVAWSMLNQLKQQKKVRLMILKARRHGISTVVQAFIFWQATKHTNRQAHICGHEEKSSREMFRIARVMLDNLPEFMRPECRFSQRKELVFDRKQGQGLNSRYEISTARGGVPRSMGIDYLHNTEVAFWPDGTAEEYAMGMLNCIVDGHGTVVVEESTANGAAGYFYERWQHIHTPDYQGDYQGVFLPWYIMPEYQLGFSTLKEKQLFESSLSEVEHQLLGHSEVFTADWENTGHSTPKRFAITLEHLHWRRKKLANDCNGDLETFHQEYPATAEEAFISSGRPVFNPHLLRGIQLNLQKEPPHPRVYRVPTGLHKEEMTESGLALKRRYCLQPDERGELQIWRPPLQQHEYVVAADVSEGRDVNGRDSDYSAVGVMDLRHYELAALWHGKQDEALLAWVIATLGWYYRAAPAEPALVCVENNNQGNVTNRYLHDEHDYPNLYRQRHEEDILRKPMPRFGFTTTIKTKPLIIENLRQCLNQGVLKLYSLDVVREMQHFIVHQDGTLGAAGGKHDDLVMMLAIATYLCKQHSGGINRYVGTNAMAENEQVDLLDVEGVI